jgi:DNA-binding response OmpR family regulator
VARVAEACRVARTAAFDFAVLDVNLGGQPAFPVAEVLRERRIPFIFSTGYGESGLSPEFSAHPVLSKPFGLGDLRRVITAALSRRDD